MVTPEFHSEPSQTSKVELFAKTVNGSELLIVFARSSILDDWSGSEYACFVHKKEHFISVSFQKKNIDGVNKESGYLVMLPYAFPQSVLHFLRSIVPGDIKGEIREYELIVYLQAIVFFFHMQVIYVFCIFLQRNVIEVEKHF